MEMCPENMLHQNYRWRGQTIIYDENAVLNHKIWGGTLSLNDWIKWNMLDNFNDIICEISYKKEWAEWNDLLR